MPRGGGFSRGGGRGFGGRGFGMRRFGAPLVMGGWGMGMGGMGSPLLTTLMAGGLGYALGNNTAQQGVPQAPPYPSYPPYPYPYQAPQPAVPQGSSADSSKLAQLQLLGELHESGTLTDNEFEIQKQRILRS